MNNAPRDIKGGLADRLPEWMRPRERERAGTGELRLIETTVLILIGLLLTVATIDDVVGKAHTNERLTADLRTWRTVTGHDFRELSIEQDFKGRGSTRETICGNTTPGPLDSRTQLCLVITGPVVHGRRAVRDGYYLPPGVADARSRRYGLFSCPSAGTRLCGLASTPAGAANTPPVGNR